MTTGGAVIEKHFSTAGAEDDGAEIVAALWQSWDENSNSLGGGIACSTFLLPVCEDEMMEYMPLEKSVLQVECLFQVLKAKISEDTEGNTIQVGPMYPVITEGDGDCLLHATSLALFGRHDRGQVFRQMIALLMTGETHAETMKQIWRAGEKAQDQVIGIERENKILEEEYAALVDMTTRSKEYLAAFHIFCLAHVLRRPIIVFADQYVRTQSGTPFSPMSMRGVYLPILIDPRYCCKQPITLVYTVARVGAAGHFTAAVGMQDQTSHVQLFDEGGVMLPIPYTSTSNDQEKEQQLREYLDVKQLVFDAPTGHLGLVAQLPPVTKMLPAVRRMRERYLLQVIHSVDLRRQRLRQQLASTDRHEEVLRRRLDNERSQISRYGGWSDAEEERPRIEIPSSSSRDESPTRSPWSPIHRSGQSPQHYAALDGSELRRVETMSPAQRYKQNADNRVPVYVRRSYGQSPGETDTIRIRPRRFGHF